MATDSIGQVALLPIYPRYARLILTGEKRIEFRKVRFRNQVSHIIMYASSPVRKIVGYFSVVRINEGAPDELWARYHSSAGLRRDEFERYYALCSRGVAVEIGSVFALPNPVPLARLGKSLAPPQGFTYLSAGALEALEVCP